MIFSIISVIFGVSGNPGNQPERTIIQTGITRNKIPYYMGDSACRWFIIQKAKIS